VTWGTGQWFSLVNPGFSSTNETDRHDITEILLKVEFNTNNPTKSYNNQNCFMYAFYECQIEVDSLETPTVTEIWNSNKSSVPVFNLCLK